MRSLFRLLIVVLIAPSAGCDSPPPPEPPARTDRTGLDNLLPVGDGLWSGSTPEGEAGFASLQTLGVRTIISVDGAPPDVDQAHKFGMRYVHIPLNYGGVTREQALIVVRAVSELPGPIYIHCHHGKHRGPTAAAIARRCRDDAWTADDAVEFLHRAGTDQRYEGLYRAVREFRPPTADELASVSADFPESVPPAGLAAAMVELDGIWSKLEKSRKNGWREGEALAVQHVEQYREIQRLPDVRVRSDAFRQVLTQAATASEELESAIRTRRRCPPRIRDRQIALPVRLMPPRASRPVIRKAWERAFICFRSAFGRAGVTNRESQIPDPRKMSKIAEMAKWHAHAGHF
jgi:protein tyrosine phosphatase (PTP) superfamily phosphohydrolase (DUF442 family)